MERMLIVPAAGPGSRLGSSVPKVLVPVNGRPMIDHLLELYANAVQRVAVVVHPSAAPAVRDALRTAVDMFVQPEPTGMLDAILLARPAVEVHRPRRLLITWCDQVAIRPETVARIRAATTPPADPPLILPTCRRTEPYTHLERDEAGRIRRILHRREGDPMPPIGESDAGVFDLSLHTYLDLLPQFARDVEQGTRTGERNFIPFIAWLSGRAEVLTIPCADPEEAIGVNTPDELALIERYLQDRSARDG
ncbi:MAG: NTP transferase domain-containing protein [Acidobacteria bacterium]|nr:NTP transferase domain-containing protein [Acidobacteriota bacterium]MCA1650258.1 NTP transferase domain-containing protein [Acidobacteriota bacterium]